MCFGIGLEHSWHVKMAAHGILKTGPCQHARQSLVLHEGLHRDTKAVRPSLRTAQTKARALSSESDQVAVAAHMAHMGRLFSMIYQQAHECHLCLHGHGDRCVEIKLHVLFSFSTRIFQ